MRGSSRKRLVALSKERWESSKLHATILGKVCHFARECSQVENVLFCNFVALVCSQSLVSVSDSPLTWVVDLGATNYLACTRGMF